MGSFGEKTFRASISILGEFTDKELEKEFADQEMIRTIKSVRSAALLLGVLYFALVAADFSRIGDKKVLSLFLLNRILFLTISILFSFFLRNAKRPANYYLSITAYEITGAFFLMWTFFLHEAPIFLIQYLNILILLLIIFIIPNRLVYTVTVSLGISLCFHLIPSITGMAIMGREFIVSIVHNGLVIVFFSLYSLLVNRYKRINYLDIKALKRLSSRDALTGIYNRYRFEEELLRTIKHAQRYGTQLSLVLFDIDNFKAVNDNFGHLVGDKVLVEFVDIVSSEIRETDFFARWGGEEFALILTGADKHDATLLANRLRARISSTYINPVGQITCSFGIDTYRPGDDCESLFKRVDRLMYMAKQSGKDQVINGVRKNL
ncbi:MAG TPA: GGDEF domain-containing protein [Clostridia bacterium]|nr:GGDEF domain-containing protein [Clostridia bacterium]